MCLCTPVFYHSFAEISEVCIITRTGAILSCIERINFIVYVSFFMNLSQYPQGLCQYYLSPPNSHNYICGDKVGLLAYIQYSVKNCQGIYLFRYN